MSFSFKTWPYPSSEKTSHILLCSKYGLIAHATNNNLSIYVEEFGHSSPLIMWCPFEHNITALGWYDASMTIYNTVPVLVLSSESGKLEVFDCRSRRSIFICRINTLIQPVNESIFSFQFPTPTTIPINVANSRRECDYVTSIKWSQFSPSSFFVGTKNGRLLLFEITIGQIVKCKIIWELFFDFEIDYICIEPQFGEICAVASKSGSVATIDNINQFEEGKAPVASPYVITLSNKTDSINEVKFYPTSTEFLILVTTSNSLLYSIYENCTAPLLSLPGIVKFHSIHSTNNLAMIVRDNSVELWAFLPNQSKRISEAKLSSASKITTQKEILASDMMGDKLIMITAQMWLTTVEVIYSSKLFVTRRVKLLDAKPTAFSYANESIAIATSIGHVLVTETSNPNFIAQMTFKTPASSQQTEQTQNQIEQTQNQTEQAQNQAEQTQNQDKDENDQNQQTTQPQENQKDDSKLQDENKQNKQVIFMDDNNNNQNPTDPESNINKRTIPSFGSPQHISLGETASSPNLSLTDTDSSSTSNFMQTIRQNKRVRKSIFNSCASSSSLLFESINDNAQQNEEILDKSIVLPNESPSSKAESHFPNLRTPIVSQPFQTPQTPLMNPNLSKKRRVSSVTTDVLKNSTVLSRVMNEGMKNMAKESNSSATAKVIPNPNPRGARPLPSIPSTQPKEGNATGHQQVSFPQVPRFSSGPSPKLSESLPKFSGAVPSFNANTNANTNTNINDTQKNRINQVSTKVISKYKFGNNCTIMWNYQIAKNQKIDHIEWIASTRAIAYTLSKRVTDKGLTEKGSKDEHDYEINPEAYQGKVHLLPRYSGASFIYLIDFKFHRISRLFDKPGISISDITFSTNKQYFFVTINGYMVDLFHNKPKPKRIHSFTFETNVYVAFIAFYLIFVDQNGNIYRNRFELGREFELKMTKSQIKMMKEYGQITCVLGRKSCVCMGTTTGYVLNVDLNTLHVSEILQMKSSISMIKAGPLDSTLIQDAKANMVTITSDGEFNFLPPGIKTATLTGPMTLLIRKKNRSFIEIFQTIGQFVPSYPKVAIRCPMMMPPNRWIRSLLNEDPIDQTVLINYGLSYIANLLDTKNSPNFTYQQSLHLRNLIMDTPQLWKTAYRLSLFLRDFETARTIIVTSSTPNDNSEEWAINMMKCSSFVDDDRLKETRVDGILFAGTNLIKNKFINDGVDILISAGLWVDAVKMLLRLGMLKDAAKITRVYCDKSTLDVLNEVTKTMFKSPNFIYYALSMLCEMGLEKQAAKELENLRQYDAAKVLSKVMTEYYE